MQFNILNQISALQSPRSIISTLLKNRGIPEDKHGSFINPPNPSTFSLESLGVKASQINKSIKRLLQAKKNLETVVIYTDYDADGVTSGAILWQTLDILGFKVMPYIGSREKEGYGFSKSGIEQVINQFSPVLIISLDHGVTGEPYIKLLKEQSIDTIVIDHHQVGDSLPKSAHSIIHSQKTSASGIAFYFSAALNEYFKNNKLKEALINDFLVFAGIGIIADLVPLVDISRSLAYFALKRIKHLHLPGLPALIDSCNLTKKPTYTAGDIGYIIAPRINAAGRMGSAMDALRLLCTKSKDQSKNLVTKLIQVNLDRQKKMQEQAEIALKQAQLQENSNCIFVYSEKFDEGIVGLLASKLLDKYFKPIFVATIKEGIVKGSARSVKGLNLVDILAESKSLLESYGGHAKAAGFSLSKKNILKFQQKLNKTVTVKLKGKKPKCETTVDLALSLSNINLELAKLLEMLEPFGEGNEKPMFLSKNTQILYKRSVGKNGNHFQLSVLETLSNTIRKAIAFNSKSVLEKIKTEEEVDIAYTVEINRWNGRVEQQLNLKHIVLNKKQ
jgi:single-stranded-DNA-specific exonuclease